MVEDVQAVTRPGKNRTWNRSFSPVQVGKEHLHRLLREMGLLVHAREGWQTKELREQYGLKKTTSKARQSFASHAVDAGYWQHPSEEQKNRPVRACGTSFLPACIAVNSIACKLPRGENASPTVGRGAWDSSEEPWSTIPAMGSAVSEALIARSKRSACIAIEATSA